MPVPDHGMPNLNPISVYLLRPCLHQITGMTFSAENEKPVFVSPFTGICGKTGG
jgi:hypothetical protein